MNSDHTQPRTDGASDSNQIRRRFWHSPEVEETLLSYDLECAKAHVRMLAETNIVDKQSASVVLEALEKMRTGLAEGQSYLSNEDNDIHSGMERHLRTMLGDVGGIVSIAKSRNDQIATVIRMWLRDAVIETFGELAHLRGELIALAERDLEVMMPGYTHMQPAQPMLISHWWLANEARFTRDFDRLLSFYPRLNALPLGAVVISGAKEPIDRKLVAEYLGFSEIIENSLDAVSDRDFLIEFGSIASLIGLHLSQMSTDLLLWATQEFGFVKLQRRFMFRTARLPFKRNPELLEVLRSRPSVFHGRLMEFIMELKAVPSGFSQDLQECLPGLLDVVDSLRFLLELATEIVRGIDIDSQRMREVACADFPNWTNTIEYLVTRGVEDDRAQKIVENLSHYCKTRKKFLSDLALSEWQQFSPAFEADVYEYVTTEESVGDYCSLGSSSQDQVELALARAKEHLSADEKRVPARMQPAANSQQHLMESKQA
jgi:argininosuccinate lyase